MIITKQKILNYFTVIFLIAGMIFTSVPAPAFAIIYQPGATLNPACLPTDTNCGVEAPFAQNGNAFNALATLGVTDNNGLRFITNNAEVMRILANGNVGIGTNAPTANLSFGTTTATINNAATNGSLVLSTNGTGKITLNPGTSGVIEIGNLATQTVFMGSAPFQLNTSPQIFSTGQILPGAPIVREGLRFLEPTFINGVATAGQNYVGFQSPGVDLATTTVWSLPAADGASGQVLSSNGTGALSWITPAGGGITSLNGLATSTQTFAAGTTGTDFGITSSGSAHTFNLPNASATARGLVSTSTQTLTGDKTFSGALTVNGTTTAGAILGNTLHLQGASSVIGLNTGGTRLRLTAGQTDTADNNQGANVDLQSIAAGGALDLVAGRGGAITFWTSTSTQTAQQRGALDQNGLLTLNNGLTVSGATTSLASLAVVGGNVSIMSSPPFSVTGGTITTSGLYTIHTFTNSGTFATNGAVNVEYLVVAGGGGGGGADGTGGGGGGAGGLLASSTTLSAGSYTVSVGLGGAAGIAGGFGTLGGNGGNSSFDSITATGGGGGGRGILTASNGLPGGSGGGSGANGVGGNGAVGQGNNGGNGSGSYGGGGGGAGAVGGSNGVGGAGTASSISGISVTYAGGGGAGTGSSLAGQPGGSGGGGTGGGSGGVATAGTNSLGAGGGGGRWGQNGAGGGSGVVIARYLTPSSAGGKVGIGTTTPDNALAVNGGITLISTTPATTTNALYNQAGALYWNGSTVGGSSQWTTSSSNIYYNTGNVAIGTSTPSATARLLISGAVSVIINSGLISTGGTVTTVGSDTVITYNSNGSFRAPDGITNVRVMAVAGGGGGGGVAAGGGGAGEYFATTTFAVGTTTHVITVGTGGIGGTGWPATTRGADGGITTFGSVTLNGGGGGGSHTNNTGNAGGSGGGAGSDGFGTGSYAGGVSIKIGGGLGFAGGSSISDLGAGAGGAGGIGENAGTDGAGQGGDGGDGILNDISGTSKLYAGGGGGSSRSDSFPTGTSGGGNASGGRGGRSTATPVAHDGTATGITGIGGAMHGAANTGGGGGGAGYDGSSSVQMGGSGGSGAVIIRFATQTTAPANQALLRVTDTGAGASTTLAFFEGSSGQGCIIAGQTTSLACSSDISLKKNIKDFEASLGNVLALKPVIFDWNNEADGAGNHIGFIAQDVEKIFPGLVVSDPNGKKALSYDRFAPIIVAALQEQYGGMMGVNVASVSPDTLFATTKSLIDDAPKSEILNPKSETNPNNQNSNDQNEGITGYLKEKVASGVKIVRELVAEKIVAVSGYFKRIFANELCLTDSSGQLVCVTGDTLKNLNGATTITPTINMGTSDVQNIESNELNAETSDVQDVAGQVSTNNQNSEEVIEEVVGITEGAPAEEQASDTTEAVVESETAPVETSAEKFAPTEEVVAEEIIATPEPMITPTESSQSVQDAEVRQIVEPTPQEPTLVVEPNTAEQSE